MSRNGRWLRYPHAWPIVTFLSGALMPPRKRPVQTVASDAAQSSDPSQYISGFIHYLKAECGLSENTMLAYQRDLTRFVAWYRTHGPARIQHVDLGLLSRYLQDLHANQFATTSMARH